MKMDVQRTYNNYAEVNSKGQQSKVRPNYYPKAKQILDNLEVDEYIKAVINLSISKYSLH